MTDPTAPAEPQPKPPRRRFTPEERIANREAETARIKEKQREELTKSIEEAAVDLAAVRARARMLKDDVTAKRCDDALAVLVGEATIEAKD